MRVMAKGKRHVWSPWLLGPNRERATHRKSRFSRLKAPLLVFVSVSALACPATAGAQPDPLVLAIKNMKKSVVPVMCPKPDPNNPRVFHPFIDGSAFFVSQKGDFITANHVLSDFDPGRPLAGCQSSIWFTMPSSNPARFQAETIGFLLADCIRDAELDIARCHTSDDLAALEGGKYRPTPVTIDADQLPEGSGIAVTGFPLGTPISISARGFIAGYPMNQAGPVEMMVDRAEWPGGSGSPVYDARGRVVGMIVMTGANMGAGLSYARTGYALANFMRAHPLTPEKKARSQP